MAIIAQKQLFGWKAIEELGDLHRLRLVLEYLPDEPLMERLEKQRGRGRDDYPVRAVWNSILAGVVFEHRSLAGLCRELRRNGQLRQLCGFDALKGQDAVPPAWVYTRFLKLLMAHQGALEKMFEALVEQLREVLPGFGQTLAIDGKAIRSHGNKRREDAEVKVDGRRDIDADMGVKTYRGRREDGSLWEKMKSWFGYKLHLVVDANYELPVAFEVTKASVAEQPQAKVLLGCLKAKHEALLQNCEVWLGDKGYDDGALITELWDEHRIKAVIDIRNCWQQPDGESTKVLPGTTNVIYDYQGNVSCSCPLTGEVRAMAYGGFEKQRGTLKYRCPAVHYGVDCKGQGQCPLASAIRIPMSEDRRVFTPLARSSYAWKDLYKKRTAVERVNSRLDVSFGFENHFIRGHKKMKLQVTLALGVMLAMALGRIKEKQKEKMRSLVAAA